MYNYKYGGLFILFGIALAALYSGAVALKIRHYEVPLGRGIELNGGSAVAAGLVLLTIGVASLAWLMWMVAAGLAGPPNG